MASQSEELIVLSSDDRRRGSPRRGYLWLAIALLLVVGIVLVVLWQSPWSPSQQAGLESTVTLPTATLTPRPSPTPTPAVVHPTITELTTDVDDETTTLVFHLEAEVPPDRRVADVLLWYDTQTGRQVRRVAGPAPSSISLSYQLEAAREGLTRTVTTTAELDYWWLVRDTAGESVRAGGTAVLGPDLQALVVTPTPDPPPVDFTWAMSESQHFRLYYMPRTAAERDLPQLLTLAEASLARIASILEMDFAGQMSIYLVPRVFWQGGAAYGDKVQLISYLDRNYTGIETWSYLTHESTHALAQDLLQPKEDGGGPDGVLVEGLAVWTSDGHYRQEPIDAWAAWVADSDSYIPLTDLRAGPFYDFQHEISYLESASFVKFLVERYELDKLKELYGLATGDATHDGELVQRLYGTSYEALEDDWLAYLSGQNATPEQAESWQLQVRSFDLMRRYETELDPDARVLPGTAPPDWTTDTLKIFMGRVDSPANVVLETALIAVQERLYAGDLKGAESLLDDVEAALDAGDAFTRPSLQARRAILDLVAAQDRAILRADAGAYRSTLDPDSVLALDAEVEQILQLPFTAYRQEIVRLDLSADGRLAEGIVLAHVQLVEDAAGPSAQDADLLADGQLFAVSFTKTASDWVMSMKKPTEPVLLLPPLAPESSSRLEWPIAPLLLQHSTTG
jgi:hypothetical protein